MHVTFSKYTNIECKLPKCTRYIMLLKINKTKTIYEFVYIIYTIYTGSEWVPTLFVV